MSDSPFVHLHCHSHYSLLDGAGSIDRLVQRAKSHGMNALALTDHGNLHGALEFYRKAKAADINPIIGYEAYIAPGSRFDQGSAGSMKEASYHLTLLAQNRTGFQNLVEDGFGGLPGGLLLQASDRQGVARGAQRRPDLPERMRVQRIQPSSAARARRATMNCRKRCKCPSGSNVSSAIATSLKS